MPSNKENTKRRFDKSFLQKVSLVPFFAFVGLGSDSLSSSAYGPEASFVSLIHHPHLSLLVAAMTILTIWAISASYCQIIELFPRGGGGYVVASKLLSPVLGLISGCALLVDYILTITISIASGVDAILSLLPIFYHQFALEAKVLCVVVLTLLNLRGIRESVFPWVPIFILFVVTHLIGFAWSFYSHFNGMGEVLVTTAQDTAQTFSTLGMGGFFFLILKAYSMGSGTYTGIEAVSNGMNIIREPKIPNAKRTMVYIALSLALTVSGLLFSYLLYKVHPVEGKTLNAVLFEKIGQEMGSYGPIFAAVTVFSEMALLFVAAETGFLGGPQVMGNMAMDRWFPHRLMTLSDHYVMRHGLLLMGSAACLVMLYTGGSVTTLVILYSLSVFITFTLSQLGMVKHWWEVKDQVSNWKKKLLVNGFGLILTAFILVSLTLIKFKEGAWLTLLFVGALVALGLSIKRYYRYFTTVLSKIHRTIPVRESLPSKPVLTAAAPQTAVLLASGLQGLSHHSIANILQMFGNSIDHFVFMQVGLIDAESYKGESEIEGLNNYVQNEIDSLVNSMKKKGYSAEGMVAIGTDLGDEVEKMAREIVQKYPECVFFGGHLVFPEETPFSRWLHNQSLHTIQRRIYSLEIPFVTIPVYIKAEDLKTMSTIQIIFQSHQPH